MNVKMKTNNIWLLLILALGFMACESDDDTLVDPVVDDTVATPPDVTYSSGTADFSTFVALGNSLTAGFSDGTLFAEGQDKSMPNIMAQQFALAGGGTFTQPLINDNVGGLLLGGVQIAGPRLIFDTVNQAPVPVSGTPTTEVSNVQPGPYNNMGVPGAKSFHLLANGYGNVAGVPTGAANPYFARMASTPTASMLEDAMAMNPTFFTLWIGNNDVLSYATSGGAGVDQNETGGLDPSLYGSNDITNTAVFASVYQTLLTALTSGGAKGVVANIPSVTDTPYFTTVPHNVIPLDAATAGAVNAAYATYNGGLDTAFGLGLLSAEERDRRKINFTASPTNAVVIEDEDLTDLSGLGLPNYRQATADDLMVLPSSSFIGTLADPTNPLSVNGVAIPLADNWVLTPEEQTAIADATTAFNNTIDMVATSLNIPVFDANAFLNMVSSGGVPAGSTTINGTYVTGGAFSLDGVHPSPRGYAVAANEMIGIINATYGSTIPTVNPVDYTGLYIE